MKDLKVGDIIIRKVLVTDRLVVTANNNFDRVTAVRTVDIMNPSEWELVKSIKEEKPNIGKVWNMFMDEYYGRLLVIPLRQILKAFFYYIKEDYNKANKVINE